jgi:8-oxo-dGTP pyrophosphatase MutT (NUDIX family)
MRLMNAAPRPASTVVLLRPTATRFEVFMVKRHDAVAFMAGAHVFPGGRVEADDAADTDEERHRLAAVRELHEEAGVRVAPDALVPFAHWVTPQVETRRYDTMFFVAALPAAQTAAHDGVENTESAWFDPAEALDACRRGDILLPPPTWVTLRRLAAFSTIEDVLAWARTTTIVRVQPVVGDRDGARTLTVPDDGTRFVLRDGRWQAEGQ